VFSPNWDGVNDIFRAFAAPGAVRQILQFAVYDRWGELIYRSSQFDIESQSDWWDGTFRGKQLHSATFAYSLWVEFYDGERELFIGSVDLLR
jgi:gliding motility-associated-like protein